MKHWQVSVSVIWNVKYTWNEQKGSLMHTCDPKDFNGPTLFSTLCCIYKWRY